VATTWNGSVRSADVLDSRDDWQGHFSVVEPGRVRMIALAE